MHFNFKPAGSYINVFDMIYPVSFEEELGP